MDTKTIVGVVAAIVVAMGAWWTYMEGPIVTTSAQQERYGDAAPHPAVPHTLSQSRWVSLSDPKFMREFDGDEMIDYYEGNEMSRGTWHAYTRRDDLPDLDIPLDEGTSVYIETQMPGPGGIETMNYEVVKLTQDELHMMVIGGNGVMRFTAVQ